MVTIQEVIEGEKKCRVPNHFWLNVVFMTSGEPEGWKMAQELTPLLHVPLPVIEHHSLKLSDSNYFPITTRYCAASDSDRAGKLQLQTRVRAVNRGACLN